MGDMWGPGAVIGVSVALLLCGCGTSTGPGADSAPGSVSAERPTQTTRTDAPSVVISVVPVGSPAPGGRAPYAWINGPYVVRSGRTIELDGSGSYARSGPLLSYEWDLNGDGHYDLTTATSVAHHRFTAEFSGLLGLRVTDLRGRTATATTHLAVSSDGDETPTAEDNCPTRGNPGQEDHDHDGLGDVCDPTPGWSAHDAPGVSETHD